ncbi:MAG: sensor domain-containing diguanylate cyclase [Ectothiorhodospiraceae bacterium]|nr:sensor domain-containing diguanylate cyclase [Ectothiorhodospiraceae bacterium]
MKLTLGNYRRLLVAIGLLGVGLAAVVALLNARSEHLRAWDAFEQQLRTEARLLAEHAGQSISAAEQVLHVIGIETRGRSVEALAGDRQFWQRLRQVHRYAPQVSSFLIADQDGRILLTTLEFPAPDALSMAGQDQFQAARQTNTALIGSPLIAPDSGEPVVPVTVRLGNHDDTFVGVAVALLNLDYFEAFYRELSLAGDRRVGLLLTGGETLVAHPASVIPAADALRPEVLDHIVSAPSGLHRVATAEGDGTALLAHRRVRGYPVIAAVSIRDQRVLGLTRSIWIRNGVMFGIFALGLIAVLTVLDRAWRQVHAAQLRLTRHNRELTALSLTDSLTGIANRRAFQQAFEREWRRAQRKDRAMGLLLVDADHFKRFNDTYGHTAGDEALKRMASAIDDVAVRAGDLVARYGGEELVILLPDTDLYGTLQVAERIHEALARENIPFPDAPEPGRVTVSIGASVTMPAEDLDPQAFFKTADAALYAAKKQGRNQTAFQAYPDDPEDGEMPAGAESPNPPVTQARKG